MVSDRKVYIGANVTRLDALGKVTGDTPYPGDIDIEGQLWMKLRFSDRPHARVLAVDTAAAEALPGVVRVFTARDVPHNEYGLVVKDQPVLCGPGSSNPNADTVRCYMDCVAVVVAETEAIAAQACKLIQVTYEDLPGIFDPFEAMQPGAPTILANYPGNQICHYRTRHGDMDSGWTQAEVVVEGVYHTGYQEHAYLQPEAGVGAEHHDLPPPRIADVVDELVHQHPVAGDQRVLQPAHRPAVEALVRHPDFDWRNPNRFRALLGSFASGNPAASTLKKLTRFCVG